MTTVVCVQVASLAPRKSDCFCNRFSSIKGESGKRRVENLEKTFLACGGCSGRPAVTEVRFTAGCRSRPILVSIDRRAAVPVAFPGMTCSGISICPPFCPCGRDGSILFIGCAPVRRKKLRLHTITFTLCIYYLFLTGWQRKHRPGRKQKSISGVLENEPI